MENKKPSIKLNWIDRTLMGIAPRAALKRIRAKATIAALDSTGYIVPGKNRRSVKGWNPLPGSADEDIVHQTNALRAGSRDLTQNTPIASGALKRIRTNVVGTGLILQSRIDYKFLGLSEEKANEWEVNAEREFGLWAEDIYCDAELTSNFYQLQAMAMYNTALSGDVFALLPAFRVKGFPYDLKVKLIEADRCSNPNMTSSGLLANGHHLIDGIEKDKNGRPIKYHFRKRRALNVEIFDWTSVRAFAPSGRRNVLHLLDKERPGQTRGVPILAPVMEALKQMARYSEAELMSTIIASFFTVFVKQISPQTGGMQANFLPDDNINNQPAAGEEPTTTEEKNYEMAPGMFNYMDLDEDVSFANPQRPNPQFEPFFLAFCKQVGSSLELPFEELILHFSSSYSASRAALLQAWKFYRSRRSWLSLNFCKPIYYTWLSEAVAKGRLSAPGFFDDYGIAMAWAGSEWVGAGMGQIDPKKETEAANLRVDKFLSTREQEHIAIYGGSQGRFAGIVNRSVREEKLINDERKALGVETQEAVPGNQMDSGNDDKNIDDMEDER